MSSTDIALPYIIMEYAFEQVPSRLRGFTASSSRLRLGKLASHAPAQRDLAHVGAGILLILAALSGLPKLNELRELEDSLISPSTFPLPVLLRRLLHRLRYKQS